ncbi:recombinase family protein, partial [Ruminococcaceae bacterium OttesenSCG-928-D13]|nr:recombinase family protein [Ruminococcaceae bacterium OttesenSCG-928-D13]
ELLGKKMGFNKTKVGKTGMWNEKTVERILKDEAYIGTLVNHKTETNKIKKTCVQMAKDAQIRHEGVFPPILDDILWKQVQAVIDARRLTKPRASSNAKIHRYAGLLRCGDCEASFVAKRRKFDEICYIEYVCSNYHRMGKDTCSNHRIKEHELDNLLYGELQHLVKVADQNCEEVRNIIQTYLSNRNAAAAQAEHLQNKLKELQQEASQKVGYLATHPDLEEILMPDILRTRDEIQDFKNRIAKLDMTELSYKSRLSDIESSKEMLQEIVAENNISNASLLILVERIIITENEDSTLDIKFKLRAPFQSHYILSRNISSMKHAEQVGEGSALADQLTSILEQIA